MDELIKPVKKRKLDKLSRFRAEEKSRKTAQEELERIKLMGDESEAKAQKWVKEDFKNREREEAKLQEDSYLSLRKLLKNKKQYTRFLGNLFFRFLDDEDIPKKYNVWFKITPKGMRAGLVGTLLMTAFEVKGIEKYDFFSAKVMAMRVGNTIAHLEGYRASSSPGSNILLPDSLDMKALKN